MAYTKITLDVVVNHDDTEVLEQGLNDAMDKIEGQVRIYSSMITTSVTNEPANAAEISAQVEP
jgi:hypothetical protein